MEVITMANILIVYYSRKGENYWNGGLKTITKGNTERVAEFIQNAVGGELFEVDTVKPYSESYMTCIEEAKQELTLSLWAIPTGGERCPCVCSRCLKSTT